MTFVDEARIFVKAGDGGKGCESFYRDKLTRYPKPDGGDGGEGGYVIFIARYKVQTLLDYRFKQHYKACNGGNGGSKGKSGKVGKDCILNVPIGTIIRDYDTSLLIKDLVCDEQSVIVVKGGHGGRGNARRRKLSSPGIGEKRTIQLELKLIADVGLIGFPNSGKSTFISSVSRVKSPIANYPFTTKRPVLGIVKKGDSNFIVADLPGLIEGAHTGRGLGDRFLRHAERTKVLLHMIDMSGAEGRDPLSDYDRINHELHAYSEKLVFKKKIVVANKMDLKESEKNLIKFKKKNKVKIFPISALKKEGLFEVIEFLENILCQEDFPGQLNA